MYVCILYFILHIFLGGVGTGGIPGFPPPPYLNETLAEGFLNPSILYCKNVIANTCTNVFDFTNL